MRPKLFFTTALALPLLACSGGGADTATPSSGPIEIHLAPWTEGVELSRPQRTEQAVHAFLTIERIEARTALALPFSGHARGVWSTVLEGPLTVDLLALDAARLLGVGAFPVGAAHVRLVPAPAGPAFVETADGVRHPLVVSGGDEGAVVLVGTFDVGACAEGALTIEFAGPRRAALHPAAAEDVAAGASAEAWVFEPLVRIHEVVLGGSCPSDAPGWKHGRVFSGV